MIFLQRDENGTADVQYSGQSARVLKDGQVVVGWTAGGTIADVPQGAGYTLEVMQDGELIASELNIGVVVATIGQSNMKNWFSDIEYAARLAPGTFMANGEEWGEITGDGARVFAAIMSQALGAPVAYVNGSEGGTALLPENEDERGYWLEQGPTSLYGQFLTNMRSAGTGAEIALWMQGEADASGKSTTQSEYAAGLETLFDRLQNDVGVGHIYIGELGLSQHGIPGFPTFYDEIRAGQHLVADARDDTSIGAIATDLEMMDEVHLSPVSNAVQAARMAFQILADMGLPTGYAEQMLAEAGELLGTAGSDHLLGSDGADVVAGAAGADLIEAGAGDDAIDGGDGDDIVRGMGGADTIHGGLGIDLISGGLGDDHLFGDEEGDELWADDGDDLLEGGAGDDILHGGVGDDRHDGGAGEDRMTGGLGDDVYVVETAITVEDDGDMTGDLVFEEENQGIDTIEASVSVDLDDYANVENVRLTGAADLSARGSDAANLLEGNDGANLLVGGAGDDRLAGGAGADVLRGGEGSDELDGGLGADQMTGGLGDDVYRVDDAGDVAAEAAGEGFDTVYSSISLGAAPANVEKIVLADGDLDVAADAGVQTLEGGAGANRLDGGGGADLLIGHAGDDTYVVRDAAAQVVEAAGEGHDAVEAFVSLTLADNVEDGTAMGEDDLDLTGNAFANVLTGNAGANVLTGGAGDDLIDGGAGDDIAAFSGRRVESVVTALGGGRYRIDGPDGGDELTGVEFVRFADGAVHVLADLAGFDTVASAGADDLWGGASDDVLDGLGGDDRILGLAGADVLRGGLGADLLDGGKGADRMEGGAGDDIYLIDNTGDQVVELTGEGIDTVQVGFSHALGANVENVTATGTNTLILTGNALDNRLVGNAGANTLRGGEGNDVLIGGGGVDRLEGGAGDDTYEVDSADDVVVEASGLNGTDTVRASVSYILGNNVERLVLTGMADIDATGNTLANTLVGNAGNNVLDGKAGADVMEGGAGDDIYITDRSTDVVVEAADGGIDEVRTAAGGTLAANVENLTVTGTAGVSFFGNELGNRMIGGVGNDTLRGLDGADTLDGGAGADRLEGGLGDDVYYLDDAGDQAIENTSLGGYDRAFSSVSFVLSDRIEELTLIGAADIDATGGRIANKLYGNAGNNVLNGMGGGDQMAGGAGDDTYYVDHTGDVAIELAGEGTDTVMSSVRFALTDNFENLTLIGTETAYAIGNSVGNRLTGNIAANMILGGAGDDWLEGGGGADFISGGTGADTFVLRAGQADQVALVDFTSGEDVIRLEGFGPQARLVQEDGAWKILDRGVESIVHLPGVEGLAPGDVVLVAPTFAEDAAPVVALELEDLTTAEDAAFDFTLPAGLFADANAGDWLILSATGEGGAALPAWLSFDPEFGRFTGAPANGDVGGPFTVVVTGRDASGLEIQTQFTLMVTNTNDAPTSGTALTDFEVAEDETFLAALPTDAFTDVDVGDTLTWTAKLASGEPLPAWLVFDPQAKTFSGSPPNTAAGVWAVVVTATDGAGAEASQPFQLTVANLNDAPTLEIALADQAVATFVPTVIALPEGAFADQDAGDVLTLTATLADGSALPAWLTFDAQTRAFAVAASGADVGVVEVRVTATDAAGASVDDVFALAVTANLAPEAATAPDAAGAEYAPLQLALPAGLFTDADAGDVLTVTATLADGSPLPEWLTFDPGSLAFTGAPTTGGAGGYDIRLTAVDLAGQSTSADFTLTIADNEAPTAAGALADVTTDEDAPFAFVPPAGFFADPGDTLTFSATLADGSPLPAWLTLDPATGALSGQPANGDVAVLNVRLTATDSFGASVSADLRLAVVNTNDAPTATQGVADQTGAEHAPFELTLPAGLFADVDVGDELTLSAALAGGDLPDWLTFDPLTGRFSGTPTGVAAGDYAVVVTATDQAGAAAEVAINLHVAENEAPVLNVAAADAAAPEDQPFTLTLDPATFSDTDAGQTLDIVATLADSSELPSWLTFDAQTLTFSGQPGQGDVSELDVQVTATDSLGASVSDTFHLSVAEVADTPVSTGIPDADWMAGSSFTLDLSAIYSDEDPGDVLTYSAALADGSDLPAWLALDPATGVVTADPGREDIGQLSVTVTVADQAGHQVQETFDVAVTPRVFNVMDFGAVGDGVTNDRAAIQAAADAAFAFGGGIVYIPEGVFAIGTAGLEASDAGIQLRSNVSLIGAGMGLSVIKVMDGNEGKVTGVVRTPYNEETHNVTVSDLTIDGNRDATLDKVDGFFCGTKPGGDTSVYDITLSRVEIMDCSGYGFDPHEQTTRLTIEYSVSHGNGLDGFTLDYLIDSNIHDNVAYGNDRHGFNIVTSTHDTVLENNTSYGNGSTGMVIQRGSEDVPSPHDIVIRGGEIYGNGDEGILVKISDDVLIEDAYIHHNDKDGVKITGSSDVTVQDNRIENNSQRRDGYYDEVRLARYEDSVTGTTWDTTGAVIQNNTITADGAIQAGYGVRETEGVQGSTIDGNVIAGQQEGPTYTGPQLRIAAPDFAIGGADTLNWQIPTDAYVDIDVGDQVTIAIEQLDAEGHLLNGGALPAWMTFDPVTMTLSGNPSSADQGVVYLRVVASDLEGDRLFDTFTVTVSNDAPTVTGEVVDRVAAEDAPFTYVLPAGLFTDPEDVVALSAVLADGSPLPAWLIFDPATGTFSGQPDQADVGVLSVRVIGTDLGGASADVTFQLTVVASNDAPELAEPMADQSVEQGSAFVFDVPLQTFHDADPGDVLTVTATLADGSDLPAWLAFDSATGRFSGTPGQGDTGLLQVMVTATDAAGASDSGVFDLAVVALPLDLRGTNGADVLTGDSGADSINGYAGNDVLTGLAGDDILLGGQGADLLDGGAGADAMTGGDGDDTYVVDQAGDVVTEFRANGLGGIDTVQASIGYVLGAEVENLTLTGDADLSGTGNTLANVLTGNAGDNLLDGLGGADVMAGDAGDDTYVVGQTSDVVTELAGEGIDTVVAAFSYTLGADVENLTLTGSALIGTGNELDNRLTGNALDNRLTGAAGNDVLDGGTGADSLYGGTGDDVYFVDVAGDRTIEFASEGFDTVIATVDWTLSSNVEALTLAGSADIDATGNALANVLTGGAGQNVLTGGAGADTFVFQRGLANGDTVADFSHAQGDVIRFEGFEPDAVLTHEGDVWTIADAHGSESFVLAAITDLQAQDYVFA